MSIKFKQFRPPGIYLKDLREFTGYSDVKGACKKAGVTLWQLGPKRFSPLSLQETYRVLAVIRQLQGSRYLHNLEKSLADDVSTVK